MSIRFAELPAGRTTGKAWGEEASALRANPGKWAHFEDFDTASTSKTGSFAQQIKGGKLKAFQNGTFEAKVIRGQVWARFVGESA